MASFTTFTTQYTVLDDTTKGFKLTYVINDPTPPDPGYYVEVYTFETGSGLRIVDSLSSNFQLSEATYGASLFAQGINVNFQLKYFNNVDAELASSSNFNGVLQRQTNNGDCLVMNTPVYFTLVRAHSNNFKSVILPPAYQPGQKYMFKVKTTSSFTTCSYMSNISYPITATTLTTTDSQFNNIYQYKFDNIYGNFLVGEYTIYSNENPLNACLEFTANNNRNWTLTRRYMGALTCNLGIGTPLSNFVDSTGSRLLYYEWTDAGSNAILLKEGQTGTIKDVYIRNLTGSFGTFYIYGPSNYAIDDISGTNTYPYVSFNINDSTHKVISFFYQVTNTYSNIYITNDFDGQSLQYYNSNLDPAPTINGIFTKQNIFVTSSGSNVTFTPAYQSPDLARYHEVFYSRNNIGYFAVSTLTTGNFFATGNATNDNIYMSNANNVNLGFAIMYKDSVNSNMILPLSATTI